MPKTIQENLEWRRYLLGIGKDAKAAKELRRMCSEDLLFYVNSFVWTYDPRKLDDTIVPFVTWDFQDDALREMAEHLGRKDVLIEKSRDMGASWLALVVMEWRWHFRAGQKFLLMSRVDDLVDSMDDMDALMPKLDFIHQHQPDWLLPKRKRQQRLLKNLENRSVFTGIATTGQSGRGGRMTAILIDEFAAFMPKDGYNTLSATQYATNSRLFNSTPTGATGAYYDTRQLMKKAGGVVLRFHWSQHPEKNIGLYTSADGKLTILDREYQFPRDYPFVLDGKLRSPWYDEECNRTPSQVQISRELDIDYGGSASQFFDVRAIERLRKVKCMSPFECGELLHDEDGQPGEWKRADGGRFKLWLRLTAAENKPPPDRHYAVSADIAAGTGASNSTITVGDKTSGEKVAEFASPFVRPEAFADLVVAVARWFNNAVLIWDRGGPGHQFTARVMELGYSHLWYARNVLAKGKGGKPSDKPGWYAPRGGARIAFFGEYGRALLSGDFTNYSDEALSECMDFIHTPDGSVAHMAAATEEDPSGARENHGDRVISDALCWWAMKEHRVKDKRKEKVEPKPGSVGWRLQQWEREQAEALEEVW